MADVPIRPLLAHAPEASPPWRWWVFVLPLLLALGGILIATFAAKQGQAMGRDLAYSQTALQDQLNKTHSNGITTYMQPGRQFTQWDGYRYEEIIDHGYIFDRSAQATVMDPNTGERRLKNVVWYPLYPILGWTVKKITGLPTHHALTLVSSLCVSLAAVVVFALARRHFHNRIPAMTLEGAEHVSRRWDLSPVDTAALWTVAFLLYGPVSVFLYANYTESLFVLLLGLFLFAIQGRWWWTAAFIAAVAASSRSQGVLFGPVLATTYLFRGDDANLWVRAGKSVIFGCISAIGLLGYMLYLGITVHDPLAFAHAQVLWNVGINGTTLSYALNPVNPMTHLVSQILTQPVDWPRVYEATCVIVPPVVLMLLGARFLSFEQEMVGWLLWGLPYVSNSLAGNPPGSSQWMSMGRFMAVALPLQLIMGAVIVRFRWLGPLVLALSVALFAVFAMKFGAGAWVG